MTGSIPVANTDDIMKWRHMEWPAYGPPLQDDDLDDYQIGLEDVEGCTIKVTPVSEPGSLVEVRHLFRRLYGEPGERGTLNPYVAKCRRLRGSALLNPKDSQEHSYATGLIDYRYWPSLKLGYIENVRVSRRMRRKGLGVKLINFAIDHMRSKDVQRIYSFAVNPEGFRLLSSAGFSAEPPENPERSWQRWFFRNIDQAS